MRLIKYVLNGLWKKIIKYLDSKSGPDHLDHSKEDLTTGYIFYAKLCTMWMKLRTMEDVVQNCVTYIFLHSKERQRLPPAFSLATQQGSRLTVLFSYEVQNDKIKKKCVKGRQSIVQFLNWYVIDHHFIPTRAPFSLVPQRTEKLPGEKS